MTNSSTKDKIASPQQAKHLIKKWQQDGQKVVFTNGCFDILHLGHIDYLEKAAALGDKLVIGINTDESVSRLKGPQRPVNNLYARSRLLAALAFTDVIIAFAQETPLELIEQLCPDILTKGADYSIANIIGAEFVINKGGEVKTIALTEGFSTTNLILKMKQA